jgi:hypothetical protein
MTLDSAQAKVLAAQPRITPKERDRLVSLLAEGKKPAELAIQFGKAVGTIYNFQTRNKEEITERRRKQSVQFEDLFIVRKQARLDDYQDQRNTAAMLIRAHLASCWATDPVTGEKEFVERLVDARKLKVYADMMDKALRRTAEETGQLPQRVEGLDERWTPKLLGLDGNNGVDYPAIVQAAVQRQAEWEARAPWREAEKQELERRRADEKAERADHDALMKALKAQVMESTLRSAGLVSQFAERYEAEQFLAKEERRLDNGAPLQDQADWFEAPEEMAAVYRKDYGQLFPSDELMRARVERFVEAASQYRPASIAELDEIEAASRDSSEAVASRIRPGQGGFL